MFCIDDQHAALLGVEPDHSGVLHFCRFDLLRVMPSTHVVTVPSDLSGPSAVLEGISKCLVFVSGLRSLGLVSLDRTAEGATFFLLKTSSSEEGFQDLLDVVRLR